MLIILNNIIFLSTAIVLVFLFSLANNDTIITVQSYLEDTQTITKSNPDITSNFTNVQWKKFVNETIGISLEYPSHWTTYTPDFFSTYPKHEQYINTKYPYPTDFVIRNYGNTTINNLEVLTRIEAAYALEFSFADNADFHLTEELSMNKYKIDGEKAGSFSYEQIYSFGTINVEEIVLLHENMFFKLKFRYPVNDYDKEYINEIKDHMINSIRWIGQEKN